MSTFPTLSEARDRLTLAGFHLGLLHPTVPHRDFFRTVRRIRREILLADEILSRLELTQHPIVAAPRGQGSAAQTGDQGPRSDPNPF